MYTAHASIHINAPIQKIWDALTLPEQVKQYFFGTNLVTDWKVGSTIFFRGEWNGTPYEDKGIVLTYTPPTSLSYSYRSSFSKTEDKPELYQIISYTLSETNPGSEVSIHQSNIDTQESADHSSTNWKQVLEALKQFVENQK